MNFKCLKAVVIISLVLIAGILDRPFYVATVSAQDKKITEVSIYELNLAPWRYNKKFVRVSGFYEKTFEGATIFDDSCSKVTGNSVEATLECSTTESCKEKFKELYENLKGDPFDGEFARVTVLGVVQFRNVSQKENLHSIKIEIQKVEVASSLKCKINEDK